MSVILFSWSWKSNHWIESSSNKNFVLTAPCKFSFCECADKASQRSLFLQALAVWKWTVRSDGESLRLWRKRTDKTSPGRGRVFAESIAPTPFRLPGAPPFSVPIYSTSRKRRIQIFYRFSFCLFIFLPISFPLR